MANSIKIDFGQVTNGLIRVQQFPAIAEKPLRDVIADIAEAVRSDYVRAIEAGSKSGRIYPNHRASAPGEAPANFTGRLVSRARVKLFKDSIGAQVSVGNSDFYARFLESGTSPGGAYRHGKRRHAKKGTRDVPLSWQILPRPALVPARDRHLREFIDRVQAAIDNAVAQVSTT